MRPTELKLKPKEVSELKKLISKGSCKVRTLMRCRILLLSSEGKPPKFVRDAVGCTLKTIQNVKDRYNTIGLEAAIYDAPRPGAPTQFDGKARAKITALACSEAPEGNAQWSLHLLADRAVELGYVDTISHTHVYRILKKTK